jgi:hypothetical protein
MGNNTSIDKDYELKIKTFMEANELIGEKIHRIPIFYVIQKLIKNNWNKQSIIYLLDYLQDIYSYRLTSNRLTELQYKEVTDFLVVIKYLSYENIEQFINRKNLYTSFPLPQK